MRFNRHELALDARSSLEHLQDVENLEIADEYAPEDFEVEADLDRL